MASNQRVMIFIDGSNLYHSLKNDFKRTDLDYVKFAEFLCAGRELVRVHYYNAPLPQDRNKDQYQSQQKFFEKLRSLPYHRLILGRMEKRPGGALVEKGVDIKIAVDMLGLAVKGIYDTAILVSGDGDFASVVEAVQDFGKHVENVTTKSTSSRHLSQVCDKFTILKSTVLKDCFINKS